MRRKQYEAMITAIVCMTLIGIILLINMTI